MQEALRRRLADRTAMNERSARQHAQEAAALKRAADAARTRVSQLETENRQQRLQLKVRAHVCGVCCTGGPALHAHVHMCGRVCGHANVC